MYVNTSLNYTVLEKTSNEAFQALWNELGFLKGKNVICSVIYRRDNSPEQFRTYFYMTLERLSSANKPICVMGDFNIDLLKSETCDFSHNFLLSVQTCSFPPDLLLFTSLLEFTIILPHFLAISLLTEFTSNSPVATLSQI